MQSELVWAMVRDNEKTLDDREKVCYSIYSVVLSVFFFCLYSKISHERRFEGILSSLFIL